MNLSVVCFAGFRREGEAHRNGCAAAGRVDNRQCAAGAGDDLVADGETDAAAALLGDAALEKLFLHVRQLVLRNAGAVIAEDELPHVKEKFFKGSSTSSGMPGP